MDMTARPKEGDVALTADNQKLAQSIQGALHDFIEREIADDELTGAQSQVIAEADHIFMKTADGRGIWIQVHVEQL